MVLVLSLKAVFPAGAAGTVLTNIITFQYHAAVISLSGSVICVKQSFVIRACKAVTLRIVRHIIIVIDVFLEFPCFIQFMIRRFDVCILLRAFKVSVVFLACIPCIRNDIAVPSAGSFRCSFKKWYQCCCVSRVRK